MPSDLLFLSIFSKEVLKPSLSESFNQQSVAVAGSIVAWGPGPLDTQKTARLSLMQTARPTLIASVAVEI